MPAKQKQIAPEKIEFDTIIEPLFREIANPPSLQLQVFRLQTKINAQSENIVDVLP
jgi:hypothetical protein